MATEDEQFDERAFDNDDDGDEISDEDDVRAIEKSAGPIHLRRFRRRIGRRVRRINYSSYSSCSSSNSWSNSSCSSRLTKTI